MTFPQDALERHLLESRERIVACVHARLGESGVDGDVLHEALLRALRAAPEFRDELRLSAWFDAVVLQAVSDLRRQTRGSSPSAVGMAHDPASGAAASDAAPEAIHCLEPLLPTLKPEYADALAADLRDEDLGATAERFHITPINLKVRRHRAREVLRARLEEACRTS